MKHGSSFTGIGGFDIAAEWMEWENVFQIENDKFCIEKLIKNFPNVKRYGDIKEFNGSEYRGIIDIFTGGFPCQPFSVAGKQKGKGDDRFLWPEMLRVIREIQPPWIVGENVPGIIRMELENICVALESEGYEVQPFIIPSASIGSWDKRDRVWIIAYNNELRWKEYELQPTKLREQCIEVVANITEQRIGKLPIQQRGQNKTGNSNINREIKINSNTKDTISEQSRKTRTGRNGYSNSISYTDCKSMEGHSWYEFTKGQKDTFRRNGQANWLRDWIEVASELCGSNARVPYRMDRIKSLGNSVNPYVAYQIFKAIEQIQTS